MKIFFPNILSKHWNFLHFLFLLRHKFERHLRPSNWFPDLIARKSMRPSLYLFEFSNICGFYNFIQFEGNIFFLRLQGDRVVDQMLEW